MWVPGLALTLSQSKSGGSNVHAESLRSGRGLAKLQTLTAGGKACGAAGLEALVNAGDPITWG